MPVFLRVFLRKYTSYLVFLTVALFCAALFVPCVDNFCRKIGNSPKFSQIPRLALRSASLIATTRDRGTKCAECRAWMPSRAPPILLLTARMRNDDESTFFSLVPLVCDDVCICMRQKFNSRNPNKVVEERIYCKLRNAPTSSRIYCTCSLCISHLLSAALWDITMSSTNRVFRMSSGCCLISVCESQW